MPLTATFLADFSSFLQACKDSTTSTDQLVEAAGKVGASMDAAAKEGADAVIAAGSRVGEFGKQAWSVLRSDELKNFAGEVKTVVSGFMKEYADAEASADRLRQALVNSGQDAERVGEQYGAMATELQKISTFSDEAITDTIANFTQLGKVGPENMRPTVEAAMNLAAFMKTDLVTASNMMMKAAQSGGEELGKLKKVLGDTVPEGANFAEIVGVINKEMGGNFAAQIKTTEGAMKNLNNQMSDINETVGKVFADNLRSLLEIFQSLPEGVQTFLVAAVSIGTALAPVISAVSGLIALFGGAGGIITAIGTAAGVLVQFIPVVAAVTAAVVAAIAIWKNWDTIVYYVKAAYEGIKDFFIVKIPAMFQQVLGFVQNLYTGIKEWLLDKLMGVVDQIGKVVGKVVGWFKWAYDEIVGHSIVPDLVMGVGMWIGRLDKYMVKPTQRSLEQVSSDFTAFYNLVKQGQEGVIGVRGGVIQYAEGQMPTFGPARGSSPTIAPGAGGMAGGYAPGPTVNVTVNMSGMLSADDPQTKSQIADLVSNAVMQGMRNTRLMGTT